MHQIVAIYFSEKGIFKFSAYLEDILTYTAKSVKKPVALSMIVEDDNIQHKVFQPTIPPTTQSTSMTTTISIKDATTDEPKGRALNFTPAEHNHENVLSSNVSTFDKFGDLSDVSMDADDGDEPLSPNAKILTSKIVETSNKTLSKLSKVSSSLKNINKIVQSP